jgi:ankyrin repeat protein
MQLLIAHGADAGAVLRDGTTALMLAAGSLSSGPLYDRRGRMALLAEPDDAATDAAVRFTLERGGDVAAANGTGNTALHGAAARGYTSIVKLLLDRGAPPGARNARLGIGGALTSGGCYALDRLAETMPHPACSPTL